MAAYNAWVNRNVYEAAAKLSDAERKSDRSLLRFDAFDAEPHPVGRLRVAGDAQQRVVLGERFAL